MNVTHRDLLDQMHRLELTETETLHVLTDAALISDHCLRIWDIAQPDLGNAVRWLQPKRIRYGSGTDINAKILA